MLFSSMVPGKGADIEWTAKQLAAEVGNLGYKKLVIRSDNEPAVIALTREIKRHCDTHVIIETSPKGDKNANGHTERAV